MTFPRRTSTSIAAIALGGLIVLAGCGSSGDNGSDGSGGSVGSSSPGGTEKSGTTIVIKDFGYSGASSVPAGAKVTVKNEDSESHTVTADQGSAFDVTVKPGGTATFNAPDKRGSYPYHCTFHSNMHGTLKVS